MPEFFDSRAAFPMKTRQSLYARGGRVGAKEGKWIQAAFAKSKKKGTLGRCTGKKFGSETCPPGSKQYAMAKTLRKINKG
jgi:hypothetical protein